MSETIHPIAVGSGVLQPTFEKNFPLIRGRSDGGVCPAVFARTLSIGLVTKWGEWNKNLSHLLTPYSRGKRQNGRGVKKFFSPFTN